MVRKPTYGELEKKVKELENDTVAHKQVEDDLRESEARYRLLARNVTDVIWTTDMNLQFTYVSPSVKQLRGYSQKEILGQKLEEVLTPASLEIAIKVFEEELALIQMGREPLLSHRLLEFEQKCKDGSTVWTEAKMAFLLDHAGRPTGIVGVTRDITQRRKTEEELTILKGRVEVRHKLSEMLKNCRETVDFWTTMKGIEILADRRLEDLGMLHKRNVRIRIIAPITKETTRSARMLLPVAELRHSEAIGPARIVIADHDNLLYYQCIPDDDNLETGADAGFWTNSRSLIETMSRAYEEVWKGMLAIYAPRRRIPQR